MKIFISTSSTFYDKVAPYISILESLGHTVIPPNGYLSEESEDYIRSGESHQQWKENMLREDIELVRSADAIVVLNFDKNGQKNYIGASAFLELYKAFELRKPRYLLNQIPDSNIKDELIGMNPIILHGDITLINEHTSHGM